MYMEEFLDLINELKLKEKEAQQLKTIAIEAGHEYTVRKFHGTLTKDIEFNINGQYIEQSELLSKLGISVSPRSCEQLHTSYGDNPFGPSDSVSYTTPECKTSVIFPTKLFKSYKKDDVKKLIKAKNNN